MSNTFASTGNMVKSMNWNPVVVEALTAWKAAASGSMPDSTKNTGTEAPRTAA